MDKQPFKIYYKTECNFQPVNSEGKNEWFYPELKNDFKIIPAGRCLFGHDNTKGYWRDEFQSYQESPAVILIDNRHKYR